MGCITKSARQWESDVDMPMRLWLRSRRECQQPQGGSQPVLRMPTAGQHIIVHDNT
jgi:hypothetical protein